MKPRYFSMYVSLEKLPEAMDKINVGASHFKSRVDQVKLFDKFALVIIEADGSYPFVENQWKEED